MSSRRNRRPPLPGLAPPVIGRRPARVGDAVKHEIATLLVRKLKDPRLAQVTITMVEMSSDLGLARVHYSTISEAAAEEAARGLESAKGFIRSQLARNLGMRAVPRLSFVRDQRLDRQEEMERLLEEIRRKDGS